MGHCPPMVITHPWSSPTYGQRPPVVITHPWPSPTRGHHPPMVSSHPWPSPRAGSRCCHWDEQFPPCVSSTSSPDGSILPRAGSRGRRAGELLRDALRPPPASLGPGHGWKHHTCCPPASGTWSCGAAPADPPSPTTLLLLSTVWHRLKIGSPGTAGIDPEGAADFLLLVGKLRTRSMMESRIKREYRWLHPAGMELGGNLLHWESALGELRSMVEPELLWVGMGGGSSFPSRPFPALGIDPRPYPCSTWQEPLWSLHG